MAKRAQLSKGELTVARAVWRLEEGTVGLIHQEVCRNTEMDYATVQTYLRRLEAKDYLRVRREGRNKVYSAKVRASKVIRDTVHDLVERLFDGEVVAMVNHLVIGFGAVVCGLMLSGIAYLVTLVRERWTRVELKDMENLCELLLRALKSREPAREYNYENVPEA